ncbi:MAG: SoxR reducing system RseC family protein [archaeon]
MEIKNLVLGIAILILTIFVTVYGISVFYPAQEYEDYCGEFKTGQIIENEQQCIGVEGKWTSEDIRCVTTPCPQGYCDRDYICRQDYENAQETRSKKIFYISIPLGILILVIGGFLFHLEAVGAGLMGGGVGTIVYGAGGYWRYGDDLFRFIISLLGLAAVIFLAYWFNRKFGKKR